MENSEQKIKPEVLTELKKLTRAEQAALLDLTPRGWAEVRSKVGCSPNQGFLADLHQYLERLRSTAANKAGDNENLDAEKLRYAKELADKLELENARKRMELLPADAVAHVWADMLSKFRSRVLELPSKLSPLLEAADGFSEIEQILKTSVTETLQELSEYRADKMPQTGYENVNTSNEFVPEEIQQQKTKRKSKSTTR